LAREQRRLAAIVAADVAGYSRLMGRNESGTLARLREHRKLRFEPTLERHGGRLVKLTATARWPNSRARSMPWVQPLSSNKPWLKPMKISPKKPDRVPDRTAPR
jgi:hypothetical protein